MSAATLTGLRFTPGNHQYRLDGRPIPSVTTLLGKGLPKPALTYWSAKMVAEFVADNEAAVESLRATGRGPMVAALKAVPWAARDEAAIRGTDIHALAEELAHGREVEVPDHLSDAVNGYVQWLDAWQPEVIWTERPVANRKWWYAGKPDVVCTIAGETWLLDWKSGKAIYGDNALQVACYGNAEFSMTDDGAEEPMPHIERYGIVHVRPDGTDLYEVIDPAAAWKDALHVIWTAKAIERIDKYIGEPMVAPENVVA
jgi:hypothetical protein